VFLFLSHFAFLNRGTFPACIFSSLEEMLGIITQKNIKFNKENEREEGGFAKLGGVGYERGKRGKKRENEAFLRRVDSRVV